MSLESAWDFVDKAEENVGELPTPSEKK